MSTFSLVFSIFPKLKPTLKNASKQQKTGPFGGRIVLNVNALRARKRPFATFEKNDEKSVKMRRKMELNSQRFTRTLYNLKGLTSTMSNRILPIIAAMMLAFFAIASGGQSDNFSLQKLEGDWEGNGEFLMPVTDMSLSVEGHAKFVYDTATGLLRTALVGEKYFFTYSDSGYLDHNEKTDSISWEVWDSFGKHAKYYGIVSGKSIVGDRIYKNSLYRVRIDLVTQDSIDFKMTIMKPDGEQIEKAAFYLWRVEKE